MDSRCYRTRGEGVTSKPPVDKNNKPITDVINMSLGDVPGTCPDLMQRAINIAVARGITVVVGSGNLNKEVSKYYPANCNNVIAVTGITNRGRKHGTSNFGISIDIPGPANAVPVLNNKGRKTELNLKGSDNITLSYGTSVAAPFISGIVALLYSKHPNIKPDQVLSMLTATGNVQPFNPNEPACATQKKCGEGIPDAFKLLSAPLPGGNGGGTGAFDPAIFDVVQNPQLAIAIGLF